MRFLILLLLFITSEFSSSARDPQIVIHWICSIDTLKNQFGAPLFAGHTSNGDGCLATLGYYDNSTPSDPFTGDWVELTRGTKIGDSSSGYGFSSGKFGFTVVFTKGKSDVIVYPSEPAAYLAKSQVVITNSEPQPGQPLCIRFYDSDIITRTSRYNAVTGPGWTWPVFTSGIPVNQYFKISPSENPGGSWISGYIFEDGANDYQTSIRVFESNSTIDDISDHAEHIISQLTSNTDQLEATVQTQQSVIESYRSNAIITANLLSAKSITIIEHNNTIHDLKSIIDILNIRILSLESSLSSAATFNDQLTAIVIQQDDDVTELEAIADALQVRLSIIDVNVTEVIDAIDTTSQSRALEEYIKASDLYITHLDNTIQEISTERDLYRKVNLDLNSTISYLPVDGWIYSTDTKWVYMTARTLPYYYDSASSSWIYGTIINNRRMIYNYLKKEWSILD